jgi:hypothetical protein
MFALINFFKEALKAILMKLERDISRQKRERYLVAKASL